MARTKAETATKAKIRSSKHPSKTFRKVTAPDVPEDSENSRTSSSLEDDASGTEDAADDSSSDATHASQGASDPESSTPSADQAFPQLNRADLLCRLE